MAKFNCLLEIYGNLFMSFGMTNWCGNGRVGNRMNNFRYGKLMGRGVLEDLNTVGKN
jgi:hypothetical protein